MTKSYRFVLLTASVSAALLLSACQPANDNTAITSTEKATDIDTHVGHNMADSDMLADDAQMTEILQDYTQSMTKMHDEMTIGSGYNDPDTAFAKGMLGHHRGAVDMAEIELKYGTDAAMRKLAQDIINAQEMEIDVMKKWLASHPDTPNPKPDTQAMQQAYADGMDTMHGAMMLGIADSIPDMAFARGMLPHHVGAVDMAKIQLKYGKDAEMLKLAQDIIDAQQPEIELMQDWVAAHQPINK